MLLPLSAALSFSLSLWPKLWLAGVLSGVIATYGHSHASYEAVVQGKYEIE
jgi:hypothetical protein